MTRIAVFSDSHRSVEPMLAAVLELRPDLVFHLGDHDSDADELRRAFPALDVRSVPGNCDWGSDEPEVLTPLVEDVRIFMTHGHRYRVKWDLTPLAQAASYSGARLALFGHTHERELRELGGVTLFNPGAAGAGGRSAGLITVKGADFQWEWIEI